MISLTIGAVIIENFGIVRLSITKLKFENILSRKVFTYPVT